jgi:hypothetical protein
MRRSTPIAGELVNDIEQLYRSAVVGDVELKVKRPHLIGPLSSQPIARDCRFPASLAFATFGRHPQALFAPEPLGALAVHIPALIEQMLVRATVSPPRPPARERDELRPQRGVVLDDSGLVTLGGACWPASRHARRSEDPSRSCNARTARRLRAGLRSFPPKAP